MPAYSILAWLRRRRAVTRGVRRPTEAFRSAFSAFTGRYYSSRPPLLLPPLHWREMLRGVPVATLEERATFSDTDAEPVIEAVEVRPPVPHTSPRQPSRPDEARNVLQSRAERFVEAAPPAIVRQEPDSVESTAASAAPTRILEPVVPDEADARPARPESPPRENASAAPLERTQEQFTSRPPTVVPDTAPPSITPLVASTSATANTAPDVRSASDQRAEAISPVSPVEAAASDRVLAPEKLAATPAAPPTTDVPAPRPVTRPYEARTQADVPPPPPSPRTELPTRAATSPANPRRTAADVLPPAARQDRVSPQAPLSPRAEAIERKPEPAIPSAEVSASAEVASAPPIAAASSEAIVASQSDSVEAPPSEPGIASPTADVVRVSGVDDTLMPKVEARGSAPPPHRATANDRDSSAPDMTDAQPASTTKAEAISDARAAVASPAREAVSPEQAVPPQPDVKREATPIVERGSAPLTNAPSGIRPTEERRGRRPRPAAPSEATQQRQATAPKSAQPSETSPPQSEAAEAAERSMVDWRRLLFEATTDPQQRAARASRVAQRGSEDVRPAPPAPPAPSAAAPTKQLPAVADKPIETEPLMESTRRFLRARVGIDPATVPVVRGPVADRLLRDAGADAAAVADAVVLPSSVDERSPQGLGLIAHELTHVAQRRQPRFVPPAVRSASASPRSTERGESSRGAVPSSEEQLARRVERSVWNDAEQIAPEDRETPADDASSHPALGANAAPTARSFAAPRAQNESSEWGGLPAPWEPLPVFAATAAVPASAPVAAIPGEQTIHYAEQGRSLEGEQATSTHAATPTEAAPPPDLDALARKVYEVLKRRLAAERRREG